MIAPLRCALALLTPVCLVAFGPMARAEDGPAPLQAEGEVEIEALARPQARAVRIERAPVIDGRLDEPEWALADVIDDLRLTEPIEGAPASEDTEIRILYDQSYLYVGVRAHDREPEGIVATALMRDASHRGDDRFMLMIDTFRERRAGYVFSVTPTGSRWDSLLEDNRGFNMQWDGIWYASSRIDEGGWWTEIAIPFKTLNFDPDGDTWGLQLARGIARRNESSRWATIDQDVFLFDVAHFGDLSGLQGLGQGLGLDVVPSLVIRQNRDNEDGSVPGNPDPASRVTDKVDPAVDIFYKITPSLTSVLTANTDFSDATPDKRRANLTRFSLFFPEQRDFFLQDSGIFRFGDFGFSGSREGSPPRVNGQPFFSRRIGIEEGGPLDIRVGGKLVGRMGPVNLGMLSTRVESYTDADLEKIDGKWLSVARASLNLFEESTVGLISTYGDPSANEHNKLFGADFNYRTGHFRGDQILEGKLWLQKTSSDDSDGRDAAFAARLSYPNDKWNWSVNTTKLEENFNPALGFANRTGIREYSGRLRRRWRPGGYWRTIDVEARSKVTTGSNDELESVRMVFEPITLQSDFGDFFGLRYIHRLEDLLEDFEILEGIVIPQERYRFDRVQFWLDSSRSRSVEVDLRLEYGEFFSGTRFDTKLGVLWRPNPHMFLSLEYEQFQVRLPEGDFTTRIAVVEANLSFSTSLFWTNLIQWDNETDALTFNSRLRWIIEPGRELILVLDPFFHRDDRLKLTSTETEMVAKVIWTFRY